MDIKEYIASGIIEAYVMGLCTSEEELEIETLRRQHPELNDAIARYEEEIEKNMREHVTLPPPRTDEKILKVLDSLGMPAIPNITASDATGKNKYNWLRIAAAAAIILFVVSAAFNYLLYRKTKEQALALKETPKITPGLPPRDYSIMNSPSITPVAMYGVGTHAICRCTMFWDKKTGKVYVMIHHLVPSTSSRDYQLWAMVNGKPVSVGIMQDEIRGRFIEMDNVPGNAIAFIVTLEKAGGSDAPTLPETYLKGNI